VSARAIGGFKILPLVVSHRRFHRRSKQRLVLQNSSTEVNTAAVIYDALESRYGREQCGRVLDSLQFSAAGQEYTRFHPGKGLQKASSYIAGLTAEPFHDLDAEHFLWMRNLEKNSSVIRDEIADALKNTELSTLGNHIWAAAAREEAIAYGPDWKTLVLQDRCIWEETNCKLFPKTVELVKAANVPSVEVFFARQDPSTGIKPHTDNTNFILTSHLGLDVPEGECWMQVGEFKKEWSNGRGMIADTSFIHSTANESDSQTRYVLIIRFWHPELSSSEKYALQFLFDALEDPSSYGIANCVRRADDREPGTKSNVRGSGSRRSDKRRRNSSQGLGLLAKGMK